MIEIFFSRHHPSTTPSPRVSPIKSIPHLQFQSNLIKPPSLTCNSMSTKRRLFNPYVHTKATTAINFNTTTSANDPVDPKNQKKVNSIADLNNNSITTEIALDEAIETNGKIW